MEREIRLGFRRATAKDIPALSALFCETVTRINSRDYTPEQVAAWVGRATPQRWQELFSGDLCFIVAQTVPEGEPAGFASVNARGYLHSMFVGARFQRRGVARRLLECAEEYASAHGARQISSEVSLTARPFFEKHGYCVQKEQQVELGGVRLTNFVMTKELSGATGGGPENFR